MEKDVQLVHLFGMVVNVLETSEFRRMRKWLYSELERSPKRWKRWRGMEKDQALEICSKYQLLGIFSENQLIPEAIIVEHWGRSILKCYKLLKDFIQEQAKDREDRLTYMNKFKQLAEKAAEYHR